MEKNKDIFKNKDRTPQEIIFREAPLGEQTDVDLKKADIIYNGIEATNKKELLDLRKEGEKEKLKKIKIEWELPEGFRKTLAKASKQPPESPKIYKECDYIRLPKKEVKKDFPELFKTKKPKVEESKRWHFEIAKREIKKRIKNQVSELQEVQHSLGSRRLRPFWEYKFNVNEKKLMGVGDLHYRALGCDVKYFEGTIDYIKKTNTAIILTGDMMENATRYSVGAGVYEQYIPPMEQLYDVCEMLSPIKKQILAVISGNHEYRTLKESGFNPAQIMADKLGAPYCGFETFLRLWAKKQKYIVYATHGSTGARFAWTKMKALDDLMRYINADVIMMAHTHDTLIKKTTTKGLVDRKKFGILTGSFLRDEPHSYGVMKCYPPAEVGVVKVKLFGNRWDIHCSK